MPRWAASTSTTGTLHVGYEKADPSVMRRTRSFRGVLLVHAAGVHYAVVEAPRLAELPRHGPVYSRPEALSRDYGKPKTIWSETASGSEVFKREWTKAAVQLNCKSFLGEH